MGQIRHSVEDDIPEIVELYEKVFGLNERFSPQSLKSYFAAICFHNPWYDEALPSLVYEDHQGRIVGFLGVMPRRMSMNGRPVQMAISHNFMVEPGSRSSLAGVQLEKTFFAGSQDISLAEGNYLSRKIWERLGGTTALLYSIRWIRLLRPSQCVLSFWKARGLSRPVAWALRPLCCVGDAIVARMPLSPFCQLAPQVSGEDLEAETLFTYLPEFSRSWALRPEYDICSLKWLFEILAQKKGRGTFRKVVVRGVRQETLGWYLYYLDPGGISEVVQIVAKDIAINEVFDHLFYDAWRQGAIALSGQIEPKLTRELTNKYCLFTQGSSWMLVHSRKPELLQAFHHGDAFLTRLEGEWWVGFQGGYV